MAGKKCKTRRPQSKPSFASRVPQPPTSDVLVYTEYEITDEPLDNRDIKKLPSQVQARMDDLYELAQHDPMQAIPELERLVTTYPHIPTFANHLSIAYLAAGDQEHATAMVREAYRRHPQYLFAKVNYANLCLQQGEIEKLPGIFDHALDLQQLYPHRTRFHVSEFAGFAGVICRYFCAINERETAALYYQRLKYIAPKHPMTKHAKRALYPPFWGRCLRNWAEKRLIGKANTRQRSETIEDGVVRMAVQVKLKDIIEGLEFQADECFSYLNTAKTSRHGSMTFFVSPRTLWERITISRCLTASRFMNTASWSGSASRWMMRTYGMICVTPYVDSVG
jgi:tetratricopeptide (TPR) repeat protein